jgi:hypothetical protein
LGILLRPCLLNGDFGRGSLEDDPCPPRGVLSECAQESDGMRLDIEAKEDDISVLHPVFFPFQTYLAGFVSRLQRTGVVEIFE